MKNRLVISVLLFFAVFTANATHIVGGGINITWLHDSTYQLQLRMLRDCYNGIPYYDDPIYLGIFDKSTNTKIQTVTMNLGADSQYVNFIATKCLSVPTGLCVEIGDYVKNIYLPSRIYNNNAGYYISWERCCRNKIIQNINFPENAGMTFYMEIPPPKLLKNSSPKWNNNPRTLLCKGNPFSYNFDFKDPDGDSLYYSLVTPYNGNLDNTNPGPTTNPLSGPYPLVQWSNGFDVAHQITGTPELQINHATGEINVTPNVTGIFVSAIKVEEFRYGIKLGEVRLELQYTISDCITNSFPVISYTDANGVKINGKNITVQIPDKICFNINAYDANGDSLYGIISANIIDSNNLTFKPIVDTITNGYIRTITPFCWQTDCKLTGISPQKFAVSVTNNGCPLPKTTLDTFIVTVLPMPLINPTSILCMTLIDNKETFVYWGDSTGNNKYFNKYNLYRGINNSAFTIADSIFDKTRRSFDDKNTPNYSIYNYTYYMRGVNLCGVEGPASDTLGTFDQLKFLPDQQKLITVTVADNNKIKVLWPPSKEKDFAQYFLYKTSSRTDTNYTQIASFQKRYDTVFYDNDVDVQHTSYCYQLIMKDTCGNVGPQGQPSCSIVLKGHSNPFEHTLSWLPYSYWGDGTQCYNVYRIDTETPYELNAVVSSADMKYLDEFLNFESGKYNYYVEAKENTYSDAAQSFDAFSRSNEIELIQSPILRVPNAFTPNNDGINDDWGIHHVFVKEYNLKVYNRWGQLVFQTNDKHQQWRGIGITSEIQQSDVYVYVVTYTGWDDSSHTETGNVTLFR